MKLTTKAIEALDRTAKLKLALALGFTEVWINELLRNNKENGPLTTAKSLQTIREETNLSDTEILEDESAKVA